MKKSTEPEIRMTIRIPESMYSTIREIAFTKHKPMNAIVEQYIAAGIKKKGVK